MVLLERQALVATEGVTLNGERARITGYNLPFAMVTAVKSGVGFEWAWETVARVVAKGGAFRS